jgi:V/A-type H+/Na+-transporting ATPase subunit I
MSWSERSAGFRPVSMRRVAVVAPGDRLRDALVQVADAGTVETDAVVAPGDRAAGEAARRLQRLAATAGSTTSSIRPTPCLSPESPDLDRLVELGRADLLAGEADLEERLADAARQGSVAALTGWAPSDALPGLAERLTPLGAAVVPLPRPPGRTPPTLLAARTRGGEGMAGGALVDTYATVPYDDVDPTLFAVLAYLLMFGIMFADAGHGLLLVGAALLLRAGRPARLARYRGAWRFVAGAGVVSTLVGLAYGEFFGPTGVVPALLVDPLEEPLPLLAAAVGVGAVLLAVAYGIGTVNRVREGGWSYALYAPSGIAGAALFLGLGLVAAGVVGGSPIPTVAGAVVGAAGLALSFAGLRAVAGPGASGVVEAVIELVDVVIRVGANLVSFARLAAFGMTHAALAAVVWSGTVALWGRGLLGGAGAVVVFLAGTALTFGLEALVAGVQALRLEYYELFSRVFQAEGRPFRPWHVPVAMRADDAEIEEVGS